MSELEILQREKRQDGVRNLVRVSCHTKLSLVFHSRGRMMHPYTRTYYSDATE